MPFSGEKRIKSMIYKKISEFLVLSEKALKSNLSRITTDLLIPQTSAKSFFLVGKRAVSFVFRCKASVTIEAAVSLSIFLLAILSVVSFGTVMNTKMLLAPALRNTCSKIAQDYAVYDAIDNGEDNVLKDFLVSGIGLATANKLFVEAVGKENLDNSCIVNGSRGISFIYSKIPDEDGYIDLFISYKVELPFQLIPFPEIRMLQRSIIHAWNGVSVFGEDGDTEEYVYITRTGTVYHTSLQCRHLNLKIKEVSTGSLGGLRNESGAKYYPCEVCYSKDGNACVYVTEDGRAYHSQVSCPTLTREVSRVPKSEAIGMPVCKSCGG